ncbi:hypothetical protein ES703_123819 [subsurface metagenome]
MLLSSFSVQFTISAMIGGGRFRPIIISEVFSLIKKVWCPKLLFAISICSLTISMYKFSPEVLNILLAGIVVDNNTFSILFNIIGRSEANSGPFLIIIENSSSNLIVSH